MTDYRDSLTFDYVNDKLIYEPETGRFFWRVDVAKNVKAGMEAGCNKSTRVLKKSGNSVSYKYIRIDGFNIPAAQLAWLLGTGSWSRGKLYFLDNDPLNLTISNLESSNFLETKYDHSDRNDRIEYLKEHRKTYPVNWKETHLKAKFGISLDDYIKLAVEQDGKCAICKQPETQLRGGKLKMLAVDHCHTSGKIRGLLCVACNQAIGKLRDDTIILESAIGYLVKHSPKT